MNNGYQPNINCIHFFNERCAHPSARRAILPNKHCILTTPHDDRCSGCKYQNHHHLETPPHEH